MTNYIKVNILYFHIVPNSTQYKQIGIYLQIYWLNLRTSFEGSFYKIGVHSSRVDLYAVIFKTPWYITSLYIYFTIVKENYWRVIYNWIRLILFLNKKTCVWVIKQGAKVIGSAKLDLKKSVNKKDK